MGGLGNVLFQLNYANNLMSRGVDVDLNCSLLMKNILTTKILKWSNHGTLDILFTLNLLRNFRTKLKISPHLLAGFISKILGSKFITSNYYGLESPVPDSIKSSHLFGYFHINNPVNETFANLVKSALKDRLKSPGMEYIRSNLDEIGDNFVVHVRGGDYKFDSAFKIDNWYYQKAISKNQKCFVVTDDRSYAQYLFRDLGVEYTFTSTKNVIDDFIVLTMCRNKILANSTFSWWAAELSDLDSIVIQREPFFDHIKAWDPVSRLPRRLIAIN